MTATTAAWRGSSFCFWGGTEQKYVRALFRDLWDPRSKDLGCWHDIGNWKLDVLWLEVVFNMKSCKDIPLYLCRRQSKPSLIWLNHQEGDMFASSIVLRNASRRAVTTSRSVVTVTGVMAREIIDSRGNPTVEVDVHTTNGRFRGISNHLNSTGLYLKIHNWWLFTRYQQNYYEQY